MDIKKSEEQKNEKRINGMPMNFRMTLEKSKLCYGYGLSRN